MIGLMQIFLIKQMSQNQGICSMLGRIVSVKEMQAVSVECRFLNPN